MFKNKLFLPAVLGGVLTALIYLAVEKILNGGLVSVDYITAPVAGVLTALAIFLLFRNRSRS
jgi:hypothetical protein